MWGYLTLRVGLQPVIWCWVIQPQVSGLQLVIWWKVIQPQLETFIQLPIQLSLLLLIRSQWDKVVKGGKQTPIRQSANDPISVLHSVLRAEAHLTCRLQSTCTFRKRPFAWMSHPFPRRGRDVSLDFVKPVNSNFWLSVLISCFCCVHTSHTALEADGRGSSGT